MVLNFDPILARLNFVFSDKTPIYIIEKEWSVLTQNKFSAMDFYNLVNNKLNLLINKRVCVAILDQSIGIIKTNIFQFKNFFIYLK